MISRKRQPAIDLAELLDRPVRVTINGTPRVMRPFEAELEQCVAKALKGEIKACAKIIGWCLREGLVPRLQPCDDHQYMAIIPKDWEDEEEFHRLYNKYGPPPWPGERDGLTASAREERRAAPKRRRRS